MTTPAINQTKTSTQAIVALVLAIASYFTLGPVLAIPALIVGQMAKRDILATNKAGYNIARAAVIVSIIYLVLFVIAVILLAIFFPVLASVGNGTADCITNTVTCR